MTSFLAILYVFGLEPNNPFNSEQRRNVVLKRKCIFSVEAILLLQCLLQL